MVSLFCCYPTAGVPRCHLRNLTRCKSSKKNGKVQKNRWAIFLGIFWTIQEKAISLLCKSIKAITTMNEKELDLWWGALELDDLLKYFVPFTSDYNEFIDALDDEWEKKSLQEKKDFYWSFRSAIETDE